MEIKIKVIKTMNGRWGIDDIDARGCWFDSYEELSEAVGNSGIEICEQKIHRRG
jgi:hypothetical protein